jgi:hypothetical protein
MQALCWQVIVMQCSARCLAVCTNSVAVHASSSCGPVQLRSTSQHGFAVAIVQRQHACWHFWLDI